MCDLGVQEVKSLKVKCSNRENGCEWVNELRSIEQHQNECEYLSLPCPYKCEEEDGQVFKVLRKDLDKHIQDCCPKRPFTCPKCQEKGEYLKMTTVHVDICPKDKVRCPNLLCKSRVQRGNLATHRSKCQNERVPCKYAEIGCEEKPLRTDLKQHETNDQLHLHIAMETVLSQNKKIKLLQENQLQDNICIKSDSPTFKLTGFDTQKRDNISFYSPQFYSSTKGYNFSVSIMANGENDVEGTHVSVYAYLMKGDNDDSLTWPFTGSVTLELLNQLEDKNHHTYTLGPFPADDDEVSGRVVKGERATYGWGKPQFIPHTQLDHNPDNNCQYLKDDTLIFRISVQVPDYKPWLECSM